MQKKSFVTMITLALAVAAAARGTAGAQIVDPRMSPTPDPIAARDAETAAIYALARAHDRTSLETRYAAARALLPSPPPAMSASAVPAASPNTASPGTPAASASPAIHLFSARARRIDPALTLALFELDRTAYRDAFIANYPDDADGVSNDYGPRLERAHLAQTGSAFPVDALAGYALDRDDARTALFAASTYAADPLHGRYSAALAHVAAARPAPSLQTIAALPSPDRLAIVADPAWCVRRPALLGVQTTDIAQVAVRDAIADRVSRCAAAPRRPAARHAAPKHHSAGAR